MCLGTSATPCAHAYLPIEGSGVYMATSSYFAKTRGFYFDFRRLNTRISLKQNAIDHVDERNELYWKTAFSIADTKNSSTKDLMLLALKIIEHAVSEQDAMGPSVSLSLYIIEVTFYNVVLQRINTFY